MLVKGFFEATTLVVKLKLNKTSHKRPPNEDYLRLSGRLEVFLRDHSGRPDSPAFIEDNSLHAIS